MITTARFGAGVRATRFMDSVVPRVKIRPLIVRHAQKPSHPLAGPFVEGRGLLGQAVDTAVDVGVVLLVVLVEGVQHLPRFLGGRGVVEVDELQFAHPTIQVLESLCAHSLSHTLLFTSGDLERAAASSPRPSESSRTPAPHPIASYSSSHPGQDAIGEPSRSLRDPLKHYQTSSHFDAPRRPPL